MVDWIYLEANKGKGIPDGSGGMWKRAFKDIRFNPNIPICITSDVLPYPHFKCSLTVKKT